MSQPFDASKSLATLEHVVAYEAGRDGFWLARWLQTRGVEASVIHPQVLRCQAQ